MAPGASCTVDVVVFAEEPGPAQFEFCVAPLESRDLFPERHCVKLTMIAI